MRALAILAIIPMVFWAARVILFLAVAVTSQHTPDDAGKRLAADTATEATVAEDLSRNCLPVSPELSRLRGMRATKIIPTLGPKSNSEKVIRELIQAGANAFRLNFSHGTHEEHGRVLALVRKVSEQLGLPVAVIQDLQGPKMRVSEIPGGEVNLIEGTKVSIRFGKYAPDDKAAVLVCTEAFHPEQILRVGERVYLSDAQIELQVEQVNDTEVIATVRRGGMLRSKKGIVIPDSKYPIKELTEKDLKDLRWGLANGVDHIVFSFVPGKEVLQAALTEMKRLGRVVPRGAKIETKEALDNLEEIVQEADFLIVARGDMGVHIPREEVPGEQRRIVKMCNISGKPVMVFTQMLPSMLTSPVPSRSDVTDVHYAAEMGADGLGLSDETTVGDYPVECVFEMAKNAKRGEEAFDFQGHRVRVNAESGVQRDSAEALAMQACEAAAAHNADAMIVFSESGKTGRFIAKHRPRVPVYGVSTNRETLARMSLYRGITPVPWEVSGPDTNERERVFKLAAERFFAENPGEGLGKDLNEQEFKAIVVVGRHSGNPHTIALCETKVITRNEIFS